MKVNGKDDIPYMKWKIKFMFETTNQNMSLAKEPCCDSIDCFAGIAAIACARATKACPEMLKNPAIKTGF